MEMRDFVRLENMCQIRFMEGGSYFHICSRENHPVLFHDDEEFKEAMNIVAFVVLRFQDIVTLTFEIMSNHFHFAVRGERCRIELFIDTLVSKLAACPVFKNSSGDVKSLSFKIFQIESLDNLRNVIAYINRNGSVVSYDYTPYTYPWGANRYFFNNEAVMRLAANGKRATYDRKRTLFHSNQLAGQPDVVLLDGYVSPACFCRIEEAESYFRHARHYYQCVSRNIEAAKDIAKTIGEGMFYTDEDLYSLVGSLCHKKYGKQSVRILTKEEKIELARLLHYDYSATNKQVARLLRLEIEAVNLLFPN